MAEKTFSQTSEYGLLLLMHRIKRFNSVYGVIRFCRWLSIIFLVVATFIVYHWYYTATLNERYALGRRHVSQQTASPGQSLKVASIRQKPASVIDTSFKDVPTSRHDTLTNNDEPLKPGFISTTSTTTSQPSTRGDNSANIDLEPIKAAYVPKPGSSDSNTGIQSASSTGSISTPPMTMTSSTSQDDETIEEDEHKLQLDTSDHPKIRDFSPEDDSSINMFRYSPKKLSQIEPDVTPVLLLAYLRSGSSFTADIMQQAAGTFYIYEPLRLFLVHAYYKEGSQICFINNTCKEAERLTEYSDFALHTIHALYTCDFERVHQAVWRNAAHTTTKSNTHLAFQQCLNEQKNFTVCIEQLRKACLASPVRIIKTIRMSMELMKGLLLVFPKLKIVHLVRDPRGITNSRLEGRHLEGMNFEDHAVDTCFSLISDIYIGLQLHEKYPKRVTIVMYEALAEKPVEAAKYLYNFIGLVFTPDISKWIYDRTQANGGNSGYYGMKRSNSTIVAYRWRASLTFADVQIIDEKCKQVYKVIGLQPMDTERKQHDENFHVRTNGTILHGFV